MAVSKRLRFEVLRRDNHTCRYCGGSAPDVVLTVDHVIPVALGGSDDPSNLVAACRDCNAGKSSSNPDAPLVETVADDALRWARAMEIVAQGRAVERDEAQRRYDDFLAHWNDWTFEYRGERKNIPLPGNWKSSVDQFLAAGLDMDDLHELIEVAMPARCADEWRYFCGCCWRRITQMQEHARAIVAKWEEDGQ